MMSNNVIQINNIIDVSNEDFLEAIFGFEAEDVLVSNFTDDPDTLSQNQNRSKICWKSHSAGKRLSLMEREENQYYCVSLFNRASDGSIRRRKDLFSDCHVIVVDDVEEKIPKERVELLPAPSFKLISSEGSEQWGYILDTPCSDRSKVENLLDGLVGKHGEALTLSGVDTGMKGVTRYVRLPEGSNTKEKRFVGGEPFKCYLSYWQPGQTTSIEQLAEVFNIDLFTTRIISDNSEGLPLNHNTVINHPIVKLLQPTGERGDGWLDIECVNIDEHSGGDKSGTAILVREDGSIGYSCHHGHCENITGNDAIKMIDKDEFAGSGQFIGECDNYMTDLILDDFEELEPLIPTNEKLNNKVSGFNPLRYIFVAAEDKYYDLIARILLSKATLNTMHIQELPAGKGKLTANLVIDKTIETSQSRADCLGWLPTGITRPDRDEIIFTDDSVRYVNKWCGVSRVPAEGDVSLWLDLAKLLIPIEREREAVLDYLANIFQNIGVKPSYFLAHRGSHGVGKDLFYKAVMIAMGKRTSTALSIDDLINGWGDILEGKKFIIVEEVDKSQSREAYNSLKTLTSSSASGEMKVNMKGGKIYSQANVFGGVMMTNRRDFLSLEKGDRRFFIFDSFIEKQHKDYYIKINDWYNNDNGADKVLNFLMERDLSNFNASTLPFQTAAMEETIKLGQHDYEQIITELVNDKTYPFDNIYIPKTEFRTELKRLNVMGGENGHTEVMRSLGWVSGRGKKKINGKSVYTKTCWFNTSGEILTEVEYFNIFNEHCGF